MALYVNDGYMKIMLEKYKSWVEENVAVVGGAVSWNSLTRPPLSVLYIEQDGASLTHTMREDSRTIDIPDAEDGTVTIRYRYRPQKLVSDSDTPRLPEWAHTALADWATYKWLFGGNQSKQARAQAFRIAFEEKFRDLKPYGEAVAVRKHFVNMYN